MSLCLGTFHCVEQTFCDDHTTSATFLVIFEFDRILLLTLNSIDKKIREKEEIMQENLTK